jgi:hypothetical protein
LILQIYRDNAKMLLKVERGRRAHYDEERKFQSNGTSSRCIEILVMIGGECNAFKSRWDDEI